MFEAMYSVYFNANENIISDWNEYYCDIEDPSAEKEMMEDIKYALRENGGGEAWIYDCEGELVDHLTVSKRPAAIYDYGDEVSFSFDGEDYTGTIEIIDKFGTFFDNSEPYYDIFMKEHNILVKHVPQNLIRRK